MLGLRVCKSIANPVTNSKFATICTDLHVCKLLVCTHGKLRGKCGNGREPYVANLLQIRCKLIILQRICTRANLMQTPNLHQICTFVNLQTTLN